MENLRNILLTFVAVFAAVLLAFWVQPEQSQPLGSYEGVPLTTMATSGPIAITTSVTTNQLVAPTSSRSYLAITNDCSSPVYLSFNDEQTFDNNNLSAGLRLNANGGSYEIDQNNRYTGAIRASSTVNCTISVNEAY